MGQKERLGEENENEINVVINEPESPPPTEIVAIPKSPRTPTLTVGLQNINRFDEKILCSKLRMYVKHQISSQGLCLVIAQLIYRCLLTKSSNKKKS